MRGGNLHMRPPRNRWPNTSDSLGILMFAQLMSEMLNADTFESFRVHSLCSMARIHEAQIVLRDVQKNRITDKVLPPVLSEVAWSLDQDPVAKRAAENEIAIFQKTIDSKYELSELSAHLVLLSRLIGNRYKADLQKLILETFSQSGQRIQFRKAVGFYCSHLLNIGYTKPFIASFVQQTFFSGDVKRSGRKTLESFFRNFSGKKHKFIIYAAVTKEFGTFLRQLGFSVSSSANTTTAIATATNPANDPDLFFTVMVKNTALDDYGAMIKVSDVLARVRAITYLAAQGMPCHWSTKMYVKKARSNNGTIHERLEVSFDKPTPARSSARQHKGVLGYSRRIFKHFDPPSTQRLLASISTSALARTTSNIENQLISLWSSVEVLLSEPRLGTPRILHYQKLLVPCICLRHVRRQVAAVCDELLISYRRKFKEIISKDTTIDTADFHVKFAVVMFVSQNQHLRKELLSLCTNNPLALHRLFKLNSDFKSTKAALKSISTHEKRVEWQVHRIYRARNNIVHAGIMPSYLDLLLMNLSEYYRNSIGTLVNYARKQEIRADIDQLVGEIGIGYEIFKKAFQVSDRSLTKDDVNRLMV